ncbi:MAG: SGNH/GDSL hydrolase family protein [Ruminococcus sp.]|nr:SGNH/GDSL hydrolase family protein [Ruminococcus sp.]
MMTKNNTVIKILGDSIAAGAGSSLFHKTNQLLMEDAKNQYFRCEAKNSWWGLLESYLEQRGIKCMVKNNGCCGAFSYQIYEHLDELVDREDEIIFLLLGLNDRKRKNGMEELRFNLKATIERLKKAGKTVIVLTPTPSVHSNEYFPNRIYHTDEVVSIICDVAAETESKLVDNYSYVNKYLETRGLKIEDIIYGEGCKNDGLHPGDFVQKLIFENLIQNLQI